MRTKIDPAEIRHVRRQVLRAEPVAESDTATARAVLDPFRGHRMSWWYPLTFLVALAVSIFFTDSGQGHPSALRLVIAWTCVAIFLGVVIYLSWVNWRIRAFFKSDAGEGFRGPPLTR